MREASSKTTSYKNKTPTEIYNETLIVVERFDDLIMANGFKLKCLGMSFFYD